MIKSLRAGGLLLLAAASLLIASPASSSYAAGANFVATGHDMDYHCSSGTPSECEYLKIVVDKIRAGSTLPILAIDQGDEVAGALEAAGYAPGEIATVDPTTAAFETTQFVDGSGKPLYSAIITASDESCGGCDDTTEGEEKINARAADFATFFNHGGGILALAGAENFETYYDFVPLKVGATVVSEPFTVTPEGEALGVSTEMANCCATHNSFLIPSAPLVVLETDSEGQAETIAAFGAAIGSEGFTTPPPEATPTPTPTPTPTTTTQASTPPPATQVLASKTVVKKCRSVRSVTVHWLVPHGVALDGVVVTLNGKGAKRLSGATRQAKISFAGRGKGAVVVKIVGTSSTGGRYVSTRVFHPCVPAAESSSTTRLALRHA